MNIKKSSTINFNQKARERAENAMFPEELAWRAATKKDPLSIQNHTNLSRLLLNLGKIEEAKTHAGIVYFFLGSHAPAFQVKDRAKITENFHQQIYREDPMLAKNRENMTLHENRVLRLILGEDTESATEYARNLVIFSPRLEINEAKRIYLNAASFFLTSPSLDEGKASHLLKQELETAKALKICTPKEEIKFFIGKMSNASGKNMRQLLAGPMQLLRDEKENNPFLVLQASQL